MRRVLCILLHHVQVAQEQYLVLMWMLRESVFLLNFLEHLNLWNIVRETPQEYSQFLLPGLQEDNYCSVMWIRAWSSMVVACNCVLIWTV